MKKSKFCIIFPVIILILSFVCFASDAPDTSATSVYIAEADFGEVVFEKAAHEKIYPASTTKIVTALVAIENGNLDDDVTVSQSALDGLVEKGSAVRLKAGDVFTLKELLYDLLLASGNDSANAIAEHIAGSQDAFAKMMNDKVQSLGLENTHFTNPNGLHDDDHYTTAADMWQIAKAAFKNEEFCEIVSTYQFKATSSTKTSTSTNRMINKNDEYYYKDCLGGKTGFTTPAGYCLISAAKRNDLTYICAIFNAPQNGNFEDTIALYDWAFDNFEIKQLLDASSPIQEIEVPLAKDSDYLVLNAASSFSWLMPKDMDESKIVRDVEIDEDIAAPISKGDTLGNITLSYDGREYVKIALVASTDVERSQVLYIVDKIENFFTSTAFKIILACILGLIILFVLYIIIGRKSRRRKRRYYGKRSSR